MAGGVVVTNHFDAIALARIDVPVVKVKTVRLPRIHHCQRARDLSIVIPSHEDCLAAFTEARHELRGWSRRCAIVDNVA